MAKNNKTLHLVLKRKWWDMIASGEKKEEYREIKKYYANRLCASTCGTCIPSLYCFHDEPFDSLLQYKRICFHLGYTNKTMTYAVQYVTVGLGKKGWGAEPNKDYFVIKLGERIE